MPFPYILFFWGENKIHFTSLPEGTHAQSKWVLRRSHVEYMKRAAGHVCNFGRDVWHVVQKIEECKK